MALIPLFPGRAFVDLSGGRYYLDVVDGAVHVHGGVLARAVPFDDLVDLVLEIGIATDELLDPADGKGCAGRDIEVPAPVPVLADERPIATCPRCQHESHEIFASRCCGRCGFAWRAPSEPDDFDVGPGGGGGDR